MKFRTEIKSNQEALRIDHKHEILAIGSCFAEHVGARLATRHFKVKSNPFGILFNPISIKKNILTALNQEVDQRLFLTRDRRAYHYDFPSSFTALNEQDLATQLASTQESFMQYWPSVDRLVITFGTAWVYRFDREKKIVANCHKIPQAAFTKELLDLGFLQTEYQSFLQQLKKLNPRLEIILTVSPVRHIKNGIHEDKLSKAILLLLCDKLEKQFPFVHYFPSYELLIDDLRDYRFYKEDMIHPTDQAVDYVFEHFITRYFSDTTNEIARLCEQLSKLDQHVNRSASADQIVQWEERKTILKDEIERLKIKA